jgi:predicted 3-demethylubiquinone-9 3-methyltransferase (glyoxalase superfamily)
MPGPAGSVNEVRFQLNGEELLAFNGGSYFGRFNECVSLYVSC